MRDGERTLIDRAVTMQVIPWVVPALVLIEFTGEDLDRLTEAITRGDDLSILGEIIARITEAA
jgi:hypothetical protein